MLLKLFITTLFLLINLLVVGQKITSFSCLAIKPIINSKHFKRAFNVQDSFQSITLLDSSGSFENCESVSGFNDKFYILNKRNRNYNI